MRKQNILFICGSMNQTTMMHKISRFLPEFNHSFTPYYADNWLKYLQQANLLDFTILGGQFRENTVKYLEDNNLHIDYNGKQGDYDLVVTCADLIVPKNIRNKPIVLVQEGMTDPENAMYYLVKYLKLPRYLASTSTMGLSNLFDKFCVASEGYKELFIKKGVQKEKIIVTGIPNFDNIKTLFNNDFPHKNFVLVATSDARETLKFDNRKKFLKNAMKIANGRQMIFKLHPNENVERAEKEIKEICPKALVYSSGKIDYMIANCDVLITQYSTVVYIGIALGKEVHSYFDVKMLKRLSPVQNDGKSAENIAEVVKDTIHHKDFFVMKKNSNRINLFRQRALN